MLIELVPAGMCPGGSRKRVGAMERPCRLPERKVVIAPSRTSQPVSASLIRARARRANVALTGLKP
jgi:hypothetical protein